MKIWLITVILVFGVIELWAWLQKFTLPLPLYLMAGALLAIASNLEKMPPSVIYLPKSEAKDPSDS